MENKSYALGLDIGSSALKITLLSDQGIIAYYKGKAHHGKPYEARSTTPESGKMVFPGQKIAYVFQERRLLPWRTALEDVAFGLKCANQYSRKEQLEIGESLLHKMGLGEFIKYYPAQLSGGMKQRVAIARATKIR